MGKNLHPLNLGFFCDKMENHTAVSNYKVIYSDEHHLFDVELTTGRSIHVLLTDAYHFSNADVLSMPQDVDYVVVVPHANYSGDAERILNAKRIGIGHIGKFMGAINYSKPWEYRTREERGMERRKG